MGPLRFQFLGTGTSAGIPAIGCDCRVCTSTDPRDQRLRTAAAVFLVDEQGRERTVLLDAGPDLRAQALRFGLRRCDSIFFTHNHVDHTFGLDEVRRFNVVQQSPIDVYAERHTLDHLRRVFQHIFDKDNNVNDTFVATLIANQIEPERAIPAYGARFTPIRVMHGRLPIVGYRIEAASGGTGVPPVSSPFPLAYLTDISAIPNESWRHLRGLKTLVIDALRHRHHPTHLTLAEAVRLAEGIGAERTYFVHMAHDLMHEETQSDLPEGMFLAWDGLVLG